MMVQASTQVGGDSTSASVGSMYSDAGAVASSLLLGPLGGIENLGNMTEVCKNVWSVAKAVLSDQWYAECTDSLCNVGYRYRLTHQSESKKECGLTLRDVRRNKSLASCNATGDSSEVTFTDGDALVGSFKTDSKNNVFVQWGDKGTSVTFQIQENRKGKREFRLSSEQHGRKVFNGHCLVSEVAETAEGGKAALSCAANGYPLIVSLEQTRDKILVRVTTTVFWGLVTKELASLDVELQQELKNGKSVLVGHNAIAKLDFSLLPKRFVADKEMRTKWTGAQSCSYDDMKAICTTSLGPEKIPNFFTYMFNHSWADERKSGFDVQERGIGVFGKGKNVTIGRGMSVRNGRDSWLRRLVLEQDANMRDKDLDGHYRLSFEAKGNNPSTDEGSAKPQTTHAEVILTDVKKGTSTTVFEGDWNRTKKADRVKAKGAYQGAEMSFEGEMPR